MTTLLNKVPAGWRETSAELKVSGKKNSNGGTNVEAI